MWHCINADYRGTCADLCEECGIAVPDCAQFLRVIDHERNMYFTFRHYGGLIRINVHRI